MFLQMGQTATAYQVVLRNEPKCCILAICDYLLLAIAKKVYHIDQNLYILSAAIGKVLFERKPLGELFVKPKRPQNDSDDGQLTLWENFFGQ